jgi:sulfofructose kinase
VPPRSRSSLRVACVGHASVDHVFEIDGVMPREATKTLATRYRQRAGGMSLHAAIAAARLGAAVRMIGRVGDDEPADFLRARLAAEGVESRGLESVSGASTSCASVIVDARGERQIVVHRGDALARAHPLNTRVLEGADLVLADPRWPAGAAAALRWAREHGVPSLLDADVAPIDVLDMLLPQARWVAFSEPGLALWARDRSRDDALRAACALGPGLAIVTLGAAGACFVVRGDEDRGVHSVPAPRVDAADTTGAGDVFHAALAIALVEGRHHPKDAAAWACAAAAFKCERGGGAEGAPTRRELQAWLRPHGAGGGLPTR